MISLMIPAPFAKSDPPPPPANSAVAKSIDQFGVDLYRALPANENVFFSPASISTAFAMAYAGARGETAQQIAHVLHFNVPADKLGQVTASLITLLNGSGEQRGYQLSMAKTPCGANAASPSPPPSTKPSPTTFPRHCKPSILPSPNPPG